MKLNHLNLTVSNVVNASAFFEKYFGFTCTDKKGADKLVVLYGKDGFILTLMSKHFNKTGTNEYPVAFHFGFILSSQDEVDSLYYLLKEGGLALEKEPAKIRDSYGFYFYFDKLLIEIGHYFKSTSF
jgi:catechol-2,3-dioxygenase